MTDSSAQLEDASAHFAHVAVETTYADLSEDVIAATKFSLLDTIGVCLAATGSADDYIDPVRGFMSSMPEGIVPAPGIDKSLTVLDATFWLGALSHAVDFDDVAGFSHPSAPVVAALLPATYATEHTDGKRLISALALGQDLIVRLTHALERPSSAHGWLAVPGPLGAAISVSHLFGLTVEQTRDSLGLALHQAAGTMQAVAGAGSAYRAIREGFNARAGAFSSMLAREGVAGDAESIEGKFGYFPQFFSGEYDKNVLRKPGFLGPHIMYKPWPCAGHPLLFMTAIAQLNAAHTIPLEQIVAIRAIGSHDLLEHQCEPKEVRSAPTHSIDAHMSIPFLIGKMLSRKTVTISDFSEEGLNDQQAINLARKVEWRQDRSLAGNTKGFGSGVVEVEFQDGHVISSRAEQPYGHPDNPLQWNDLVQKFKDCVALAANPLNESQANSIISVVEDLESLKDARMLLKVISDVAQRS